MPQARNSFDKPRSTRRVPSRLRVSGTKTKAQGASLEEMKRQMILAHAERRRAMNDPTQVRLLWAGVVVTFVVIVVAWGYATLPHIFRSAHGPMVEVDLVKQSLHTAELMKPDGKTDDVARSLADVSNRLEAMQQATASAEKTLNTMAGHIEGTSTEPMAPRPELFQPSPTSTSSTTPSL